jgi:signal transduction histidine kinase
VAAESQFSDVLSEFARNMVTDFPIRAVLDRLVVRIVDVMPISAAGLTLIAEDISPRYIAASNDFALRLEKLQTELVEGPCIAAYQGGISVSIADLSVDQRFPNFSARAVQEGLKGIFTFPLHQGDMRIGALDLYRTTVGPLENSTMDAAQTLADVAAAYLISAEARAELWASQLHELSMAKAAQATLIQAQEDERRRIAADIHDDSVQALIAASLRLTRLRLRISDTTNLGLLDEVEQTMAEAVIRLRRLMFDLAPSILDEQGIAAGLRLYLTETFDSIGLQWTLVDDVREEFGRTTLALAYRLTRELLTNVVKHAEATHVEVAVNTVEDGIAVRVTDDGTGFDADGLRKAAPGHLGLRGLFDMAQAANGHANIQSSPGGVGSTCEFWLPNLPEG